MFGNLLYIGVKYLRRCQRTSILELMKGILNSVVPCRLSFLRNRGLLSFYSFRTEKFLENTICVKRFPASKFWQEHSSQFLLVSFGQYPLYRIISHDDRQPNDPAIPETELFQIWPWKSMVNIMVGVISQGNKMVQPEMKKKYKLSNATIKNKTRDTFWSWW